MSKFKALKEIIEGVAPAVAKEGEEAAASALAKEAEEAAAREAYKAEFDANPIIYHGSGHNNIEEFIPSEDGALGGPGIYATTNPNIASVYANGAMGSDPKFAPKIRIPTIYPLKYRGRTFNDTNVQDWLDLMKALNIPYSHSDIPSKGSLASYPSVREKLVKLKGLTNALRESDLFTAQKYQDMIMVLDPKNVRSIFAKFDPKKRNSGNIADSIVAATTGAGAYSALSPESAEASEIKEKPKSQLKDLLKDYSPSFGSKTGDYSSYDESEALPTEGMQGQGLATIIRNIIADKKPPSEFEEGGGGIEESAISPIDLVTPGMVTTPAKALGRGALTAGKAGLEAVESGAQALAKRYPELAKRLMDNRGELTLPQMRNVAKLMGKNPTETELAQAAELPDGFGTYEDYTTRRIKEAELSDFVHKERLGIPHDTPGEQVLEKVKNAHTELTGDANIPIAIDPEISNYGEFRDFGIENRLISSPAGIVIKDPNKIPAGILAHELGHAIDARVFPSVRSLMEAPPNTKFQIVDKLLAINPELTYEEAIKLAENFPKTSLLDAIKAFKNNNKDIISLQDIAKAGHHYRYPRNFEMQRSIELLNPDKPFSGPSLSKNAEIIKEILYDFPPTVEEAGKLYTEKEFPNIEKLLKEIKRRNW